jgi:hypothetical protein
MNSSQIVKYERCKELTQILKLRCEVHSEYFKVRDINGLIYGTFESVDCLYNYLIGYEAGYSAGRWDY